MKQYLLYITTGENSSVSIFLAPFCPIRLSLRGVGHEHLSPAHLSAKNCRNSGSDKRTHIPRRQMSKLSSPRRTIAKSFLNRQERQGRMTHSCFLGVSTWRSWRRWRFLLIPGNLLQLLRPRRFAVKTFRVSGRLAGGLPPGEWPCEQGFRYAAPSRFPRSPLRPCRQG